jgi:CubicO group peptidase (beta-lactamase class C family)
MKPIARLASWIALALGATLVQAQDLEAKLDQAFKPWAKATAPGGVASVSVKGEIVYQKAFGLANLELKVPNTTDTVFDVGSVSKQFTATCVMLLQDDGKLNIDDQASKYLPEYPVLKDNKITVRQLISHTSGVRDYMALMAFKTGNVAFADEDVVETLQGQRTLNFAPGTAWDYSNTGYYFLKKIVESVSGKSLALFARERIFEPLEMKNTYFMDDPTKIIPGRAFGYVDAGTGFRQGLSMIAADGAGGLWTTLADMHKWTQNWKHNKLGSDPEMFKKMQIVTKLNNGEDTIYGLGFFLDDYKGVKRIQHGGDFIGFHALVSWYPEQDIVITTFSNDGTQRAKSLNDAAASVMLEAFIAKEAEKTTAEVKLSEAELDEYVGSYDIAGRKLEFKREGTQLKAQLTGQQWFDVFASEKDHFFYKVVEAYVVFQRDESGAVNGLLFSQGGSEIECPRSQSYTLPTEKLPAFVGLYYSEELDVIANVKVKDGALVVVSSTILDAFPFGFANEKRINAGPLVVDVEWEGDRVKALLVSMPRAGKMRFERMSSIPPGH